MNKVTIIGRLVRDPEIRYTQGNEPMCIARYTLAVDRPTRSDGQREADFPNCIAFGKRGEFAEKYLHKGMKIAIHGRLQTGSYTNKDGQKVYTTDIIVEEHEFCESKSQGQTSQPTNSGFSNAGDGFMDIPDSVEDSFLPFN